MTYFKKFATISLDAILLPLLCLTTIINNINLIIKLPFKRDKKKKEEKSTNTSHVEEMER